MNMKRVGIITALSMVLVALSASVALAAVTAGTYGGSVNSANAPGSSHLTSGTIQCVVAANTFNVTCNGYTLGGVGHTDATVNLTASYTATINCTNQGGNLVESHTAANFAVGATPVTVTSVKNGQLTVPQRSVSASSAPQVCPNDNWTPSIAPGTLVLNSFRYTLTFAGFTAPAVLIAKP
jgi:hypothetical protein